MELDASRTAARADAAGEADPAIGTETAPFRISFESGGAPSTAQAPGRLAVRAVLTHRRRQLLACHAAARTADATDWSRIAGLYAEQRRLCLARAIIELNRAVAVGMARRRAGGKASNCRSARRRASARGIICLPSVRGDLLQKLARYEEAKPLSRRRVLAGNQRERDLLMRRAAEAAALSS